jgi:hypothetical protein
LAQSRLNVRPAALLQRRARAGVQLRKNILYSDESIHLDRLAVIELAKIAGFGLAEIRVFRPAATAWATSPALRNTESPMLADQSATQPAQWVSMPLDFKST